MMPVNHTIWMTWAQHRVKTQTNHNTHRNRSKSLLLFIGYSCYTQISWNRIKLMLFSKMRWSDVVRFMPPLYAHLRSHSLSLTLCLRQTKHAIRQWRGSPIDLFNMFDFVIRIAQMNSMGCDVVRVCVWSAHPMCVRTDRMEMPSRAQMILTYRLPSAPISSKSIRTV